MRSHFDDLAKAVCTAVSGTDRVSLAYCAESSHFIRFNHAAVRQAGHVDQRYGTVTVVFGARQASATVTLSGELEVDREMLLAERALLIGQLPFVPEDNYLLLPQALESTERHDSGRLPTPQQLIDAVHSHAAGTDLVGFYAGGPVVRAYADSRGQRNWHSVESFLFEWCLYHAADQAVKSSYAGSVWDDAEFARRMAQAREQLALLALPVKTLAPGQYRAYFTPVAMADLLATLSWGGFGLKSARTGVSTLMQLHRGEVRLHPGIDLTENGGQGIAPSFQLDGFVKPPAVPLVRGGRSAGTLNSPRSAREYGASANGSSSGETPESLTLATGTLAAADVLPTLGTGVYVSNLHYLNYSDRLACRMTGMTRFACFWVEAGAIVAPIAVMRFDDSFLRMFGEGLVALTQEAELVPDGATYGARQLASVTTPGAIVEGLRFTL